MDDLFGEKAKYRTDLQSGAYQEEVQKSIKRLV